MSASFLALIAQCRSEAVRVRWADSSWSGHELVARIDALAATLASLGATRIASRLDNGPDWLVLDLAIRQLGLIHVPLPTFFSREQVAHALTSSGVDMLVLPSQAAKPDWLQQAAVHVLSPTLQGLIWQPESVDVPAGTAVITFTSGTTGTPKGVCLSAEALLTVARSLRDAARPLAPKRHLCLMPLSTLLENIGGVYAALMADAEILVPGLTELGYSGAAGLEMTSLLASLHRYQPESLILVPQLLLALVMAAERGMALPSSLKFLAVGGARVGHALIARAQLQGLPVYEGYGLSECASVVCLNRPDQSRAGSVGRVLPHARIEIQDGELLVEGTGMLGYLGDAPRAPGPIATGDLGFVDADGYVYITGRRKNMFITSFGRNVSPEWVESELLQHPLIAQAVVFGEARPFNTAVIRTREPDCDESQLRAALSAVNQALPDYARVQAYVRADAPLTFAEGLLTSNGRPRRDRIYARYAQALDACYGTQAQHQQQGVEA